MEEQKINELVRKASQNPEAFTELYYTYQPIIYNYIARRVGNVADAEDVSAQVFEKALRGLKRFDPELASFKTWLFRIANNAIADYFREKGRHKQVNLEDAEVLFGLGTGADSDYTWKYLRVMALIKELPLPHQEVLVLRFIKDVDNEEIARILGTTESHVAVKLYRALRHLRRLAFKKGVLEDLEEGVLDG